MAVILACDWKYSILNVIKSDLSRVENLEFHASKKTIKEKKSCVKHH